MTVAAGPAPFVVLPVCTRHSLVEELYASMAAIRVFEQSLLDLFDAGALVGTTHTCIGQEATAVGVLSALDLSRDIVFSNHRGHGHFLAYCGEVERLYLEVMGKPGGICAGRGGSQHLHIGNFYSNGIQGGIVPVATGMALAEKVSRSGAIAVVMLGDGTLGEGAVYESFNIASLWSVPVLFAIDDNGYAQSTPRGLQLAGSIRARLEAFGIPVSEAETTDVRDVLRLARDAVDTIRTTGRPHGLILHTYRLGPHSKGDDTRDPAEIEAAWAREPLVALQGAIPETRVVEIMRDVEARVAEARERALAASDHDGGSRP